MNQTEPHFVQVTIWEFIMPNDRGDRYEDPLDEVLESHDLGQVCGGGSQLSDECGIEYVDIEIELNDIEKGVPIIREVLEEQGVPKGSLIRYEIDGQEITSTFGVAECLAIFLDGVSLPDEVYQTSDINELADKINEILDEQPSGEIRSSWAGPQETALFIFSTNAQETFAALAPLLHSFPLAQNARIVIRHGKPELNPETVRIPMLQ